MPNEREILKLSACEQARLLHSGELSSLELTNIYLARIEASNDGLMAFTHVAPRRARWAASRWDKSRARGLAPESPLSGVPTGVKDLAFVRGMPTRFGSRAVPPISPLSDGTVTKRIRAAGMVITGKLSTSEFGAMPVTETDTHAPTRNAFNQEYTSGGSSGGSGTAVAAGLLPIAQGSDGAGSIRIPSAVGHLVGLKPTRGLISHVTPVDTGMRLSTVGGLGRTVEDAAAFLDVLADWPQDFVGRHKFDLPKGLRVKVSTESPICETAPEYQAAAEKVASILGDYGCEIAPADLPEVDLEDFLLLWKRLMANAPLIMESRLQPITAWLRSEGKKITKVTSIETRIRLEQYLLDSFENAALWVTPTIATKPPKIGAWKDADPETSFRNILGLGVYTAAYNVSGQPAITVPMGLCEDGLPIGVQIAGRTGCDAQVLQAARVVEQAVGGFRGDRIGAAFC
ncbi:MAG: amidase [Myxococcales bacterium]|nr:amidase [Myxococcales bacterium]